MRLLSALTCLGLSLCLSGCEGETAAPPANLAGTYDLVLVKDLVFVTSTVGNEIRALDIVPVEGKSRDYVRAPNPLQPLSIPVSAGSPVDLARDVYFVNELGEGPVDPIRGGQYVFARGAGREISLIGAGDILKEIGLITAAGAVTAVAGAADPLVGPADGELVGSRLFFASQTGTRAELWSVNLPKVADAQLTALEPQRIAVLDGETIVSIAVLPPASFPAPASAADAVLAIATRAQSGLSGRALLINSTPGPLPFEQLTPLPLQFPQAVRALFVQPGYANAPTGARVYGLLEEQVCQGAPGCSGIAAVTRADGLPYQQVDPANLYSGVLPIDGALPLDLTFFSGVDLGSVAADPALVGIVPASNGRIYLVDLETMQPIPTAAGHFFFIPSEQSGFSLFTFPAAAIYSEQVGLAYVADPSANAILEFNPRTLIPNDDQGGNLNPYR